jgi:hypothetical protein
MLANILPTLVRGGDPLAQKILKFEGSFGEILSIFPLSK